MHFPQQYSPMQCTQNCDICFMKSGCGSGPGTGGTGREQGSGTKQVTASRQALAKSGPTGRDQRATLAKQDYEKSPLHGLEMSCFWTTIMRVDHQEEREAPEDHNHQKMNQQRAQGGECRGWSRAQGQGWDSGCHSRAPAQQETGILSCPAQQWDVISNTWTNTPVPAANLKEIQSSLMRGTETLALIRMGAAGLLPVLAGSQDKHTAVLHRHCREGKTA